MTHTYSKLIYHFVWSTKERKPNIHKDIKLRLYTYILETLKEYNGLPIIINGTEDHIHILTHLPLTSDISQIVRALKSGSTKWMRKEFKEHYDFAWQEGYGIFSVGNSCLNSVIKYIENQEEHHKKITFAEEYLHFLNVQGIKYDPRFVLG